MESTPRRDVRRVQFPKAVLCPFDLGRAITVHTITTGLTNRCWKVGTSRKGRLFVKQFMGAGAEPHRIRHQHQALGVLAERGLPVVAPLATPDGHTLVKAEGGHVAVYPWVEGHHVPGWRMSVDQAHGLGGLLARIHHEWARALTPCAPTIPAVADRDAALRAIDTYREVVAQKAEHDVFDRFVGAHLRSRRALLASARPPRLPTARSQGPAGGWTHGDFHIANVLWDGDRIAAVLDFDALGVRSYAHEVVHSVMLLFPSRNGKELAARQAGAFVSGYRELSPLSDRELREAAASLWWERACDLRHLERHYLRHDPSRDHLFATQSLLLSWWSGHPEEVATVLAGG
ncbi:phosphotransferase enzyme family protein [Streptomyces sp. NPDC004296]|uniref:phosphotransferase enzyme family protein n=1 Tax=Streptomyces sp. NPDC004296 TaxID=3364697 RepID=UPI0036AAD83A